MGADDVHRIERVVLGVWGEIRTVAGVADLSGADRIAFRSDSDLPLLNMVFAVQLGVDPERRAEQIVEEFIGYGRPWTWWVTPSYSSRELTAVLHRSRLRPTTILGVGRSTESHAFDVDAGGGLRFEQVEAGDERFVSTLARAYGIPEELGSTLAEIQRSVRTDSSVYVLAHDGDRPVGTASGFFVDDIVEIHNVSTIAGDSVARSSILHLVEEGWDRGCTQATGIADGGALKPYERAGFRLVCETTQWVWQPVGENGSQT